MQMISIYLINFNKDKLPLEIKQVFYKEFLFGEEEAKLLA